MIRHSFGTILLNLLLLSSGLLFSIQSFSQCLNPFQYPVGLTGMLNDAQQYTISVTSETTKHSRLGNVLGGETYEFSVSRNGVHKYVTVRQGAFNGSVVGHGPSPLQITATGTLDLFVHWSEDASCAGSTLDHTITYQCLTCTPPPPPANDGCDGAVTFPSIPTDGSCATVSSSTEAATESLPACTGSGADDDVWLSFVATAPSHTILIQNITPLGGYSNDMAFEVFSGTCNGLTSILCSDPNSATANGLTPGNTYFIRVFTMLTANRANFDVCISTPQLPPPNNQCNQATPVDCSSSLPNEDATLANAADNPVPCSGSLGAGLWYSFTGTGEYLTVSAGPSGWDAELGIYAGTCGAMVCEVSMDQQGAGGTETIADFPTIQGQPYAIFVSGNAAGVPGGPFALSMSCAPPPPPPANDDCAGAFAFPALPTDGSCISLSGVTAGATESEPGCMGTANDDVWFSCVVPSDELDFSISNVVPMTGASTDMVIELFSGSCGSLVSLLCSDPETGTLNGLTPGSTVYLRVHTLLTSSRVSFDLCLSSPPPPPINDFCNGALFLNQGTNTGTTWSATPDWPTGLTMSCNVSYDNNVWFQFQAYAADVTIDVTNITGDLEGVQVGIFELPPDCSSTQWSEIDCVSPGNSDDFSIPLSNLVPGGVYLVIVDGWAGSENNYDLTITGGGPLPVEVLDFSGRVRPQCNELSWTVRQEIGISHYVVRKSWLGLPGTWATIGSVNAKGGSDSHLIYQYPDCFPQGSAYYQLQAFEENGATSLSSVIYLERQEENPFVVFPNPSDGHISVRIPGAGGYIVLSDTAGRVIESHSVSAGAGSIVSLDGRLAPGVYLITLVGKSSQWVERIVITGSGQ